MTDYLLQQSRTEYYPCLDLTAPIHQAYADRHGFEYVVHKGALLPDWTGHWDAIPLMINLAGQADTGLILWLDADALLVGDADPRDVMAGFDVGMARHPGPPEHYNCGVLMLRACADTVAWLERILANGPGAYPWYQQVFMNRYLEEPQWAGRVKTLPHEWNSTAVLGHTEDCIIRAWHGYPGGPAARCEALRREIRGRAL
jgi:hypothetical protein